MYIGIYMLDTGNFHAEFTINSNIFNVVCSVGSGIVQNFPQNWPFQRICANFLSNLYGIVYVGFYSFFYKETFSFKCCLERQKN
jgi:hypothetical protein